MFGLFSKRLSKVLNKTEKVKVSGVIFRIRKINPLDYVSGAKAMQQIYDTYEGVREAKNKTQAPNPNLIKAHYIDVLMAGIVEPVLTRKPDDNSAIFVENLFNDWDLVNGLYEKIMELTYGKKKLKQHLYHANGLSRST